MDVRRRRTVHYGGLTALLAACVVTSAVAPAGPAAAAGSTTTRVSVSTGGAQGAARSSRPAISADGRYLVFGTGSALVPGDTNGLYDVYVRDLLRGTTSRVSLGPSALIEGE